MRISPEQSAELSRRIIYSHSAGTGEPFPADAVRAAMLLRANVLARAYSGVRLSLFDTVLDMINKGVVPFIHEKGSLGVSGDLSPMSQFAEVAISEGQAYYKGEILPGAEAMKQAVAANLLRLFVGSEIMADKTGKVQDGYSMRCTPQALGPSFDTLEHVRKMVNIEVNSAADNPLFFGGEDGQEGAHFAAGNFHGQPIGMAVDFLCIALAEVADLSERHTNRLLNPVLSGLPDFLVEGKGLNSGLMVAQYTAAALVSENKVLSHPAS